MALISQYWLFVRMVRTQLTLLTLGTVGLILAALTYYGNRKARASSRRKEEVRRLLSYFMTDGYGSYLDGLFNLRATNQVPIYSAQALIAHQMSTHCGRNLK